MIHLLITQEIHDILKHVGDMETEGSHAQDSGFFEEKIVVGKVDPHQSKLASVKNEGSVMTDMSKNQDSQEGQLSQRRGMTNSQ